MPFKVFYWEVKDSVEELANTSQNVKAALQKITNPKTYRQLLDHMKEALRNENGSIDLSSPFRNLGKLRSALAKADTAEDAIRCCEEIIEEEAFQNLLQEHSRKDVGVVVNYMKNLISAAEKAGEKLAGSEVDYIIWSCDHGIEGQNCAADVLADGGYQVEMLKEVHIEEDGVKKGNGYGIDPGSNPDYLIEKKVFDAYTPEGGTKLKTIKKKMVDKINKQTDNIVLVTKYYNGDVGELKVYLLNQTKHDLKHLRELKAIVNGKVETWFVR